MCGRFVQKMDPDDYASFFGPDVIIAESLREAPLPHSYNVAPTDQVYGLVQHEAERRLGSFRWGLIPHYSKDRKTIHINARVETIDTKPAFRDSFTRRRCLIPADGFFEWQRSEDGTKQPFYLTSGTEPMALAGLWSRWRDPITEERVITATIITTDAASNISGIHDRMPVALTPDLWDDWLDPGERDPATTRQILDANDPSSVTFQAVSTRVNSVRNNAPDLIEAI